MTFYCYFGLFDNRIQLKIIKVQTIKNNLILDKVSDLDKDKDKFSDFYMLSCPEFNCQRHKMTNSYCIH